MAKRAWLKNRLREVGKKQSALAEVLGLPAPRVSEMISGKREIHLDEVPKIARFLEMTPTELARRIGVAWQTERVEPTIVGYVGAGERVYPIDDHAQGAGLDTTDQPPGEKGTVVAVIVRGNSMEPTYRDGDLLFYAEEKRSPADLIGLDCIVKVHEGPTFIKTIRRHQKRGHFTLKSYNAEDIGPVQVETAYPVRWIKRKV